MGGLRSGRGTFTPARIHVTFPFVRRALSLYAGTFANNFMTLRGLGRYSTALSIVLLVLFTQESWGAGPKVKIITPRDGARIEKDKDVVVVTGKVSTKGVTISNVDLFLVVDISASTAHYAGVRFNDKDLPRTSGREQFGGFHSGVFAGGFGRGRPIMMDLRSSILAAEVAASHRLLSQLNPKTTRVGLITFGESAALLQPLTRDFDKVRSALDEVFISGPHGGTHMVGGIRLGIRELSGIGQSERRKNVARIQMLLTDGFPTLPIGRGKEATEEDTNLAINAARIAKKARIKIHVFALGEDALSSPRAAVGVASMSKGIFTPVVRPADILNVFEKVSVIGVDTVEVFNETTGKRASEIRLASDGYFSSALTMVEGVNRINVRARVSGGGIGRDMVSVVYQPPRKRSLDVEVFMEESGSFGSESQKLDKMRDEIERELGRSRTETQGSMPADQITTDP